MKKSLLGIVFIFILVGCGKYVEPKLNNNLATLVLKDRKDGKRSTYTLVEINNQKLETYNSLITKIRVEPGNSTISLDSTIYYGALAKRAELVSFTIDFKPRKIYTVEIIPHTLKLKNDSDNVKSTYRVFENEKLILQKDVIFSDRVLKSSAESEGMTSADIATAVIQAVVLPAM